MKLEVSYQEVIIDLFEESLDSEIYHPVILSAALAAALLGVVGRPARSIAVGVLIKERL